jgi:hypothetical protein
VTINNLATVWSGRGLAAPRFGRSDLDQPEIQSGGQLVQRSRSDLPFTGQETTDDGGIDLGKLPQFALDPITSRIWLDSVGRALDASFFAIVPLKRFGPGSCGR